MNNRIIAHKDAYTVVCYTDQRETWNMIQNKHYAGRIPPITRAYGLHENGKQIGALTIGQPASRPLCTGLLGEQYADQIKELNRLVVSTELPRNTLSWYVSKTLRDMAGTNWVIVSFADEGAGHQGYIYQATNWHYLGKSKPRTDKWMPGNKHPRHYTDEYVYLRRLRTPKHKYVYAPDKKMRSLLEAVRGSEFKPYPKAQNTRYQLGKRIESTVLDTRTGKTHKDSPDLLERLQAERE